MIGLTAFRHLVQHPRGGDATLRRVEHQHATDIARAGELVLGAREHAAQTVEIVTRGEAVLGDEGAAFDPSPHPGRSKENLVVHLAILPPSHAASMHAAMESSAGL
jgi:hypothetical protein